MLDFNSTAMKRSAAVSTVHEAIEAALIDKAQKSKRRTYLGASGIGAPCQRRTQHEYMGHDYDADYVPEARTQRIFARGHIAEKMAIDWLGRAGYDLRTHDKSGEQHGFSVLDGKFSGHCDGVIVSGPGLKVPCLWEHKALGGKSWRAIDKHGLAKAKPEYADQVAIYQAYMDLTEPCLFQATNMDTMELYFELVLFDAKRAQAASDRAVDILKDTAAGALRPRVSDDPDFWLCRNCPFKGACHGVGF